MGSYGMWMAQRSGNKIALICVIPGIVSGADWPKVF